MMSRMTAMLKPKQAARSRGFVQRKCACGGKRECDDCGVHRSATTAAVPAAAAQAVDSGLSSSGRALDSQTRSVMESRIGHDFSQVRIHSDAKAAASAAALNAHAYTVGQDIVFGAGQYSPASRKGQHLLAHELAHVVQQRQHSASALQTELAISHPLDTSEREADAVADAVTSGGTAPKISADARPRLQRRLVVDDPKAMIPNPGGKGVKQTNAQTVEGYLQKLCSAGSISVNSAGGVDIPKAFCKAAKGGSQAANSSEPTGCTCLCELDEAKRVIKIVVDDSSWPHTSHGGRRVTVPSPNNKLNYGAATKSGKLSTIDPWLILGHELCGHAWLMFKGKHHLDKSSQRGKGGHQKTVERENLIRKEHGIEERGRFKEPYCGESFSEEKAKPGTLTWSYLDECEAWRKAYNKRHKTNYKITDTIP